MLLELHYLDDFSDLLLPVHFPLLRLSGLIAGRELGVRSATLRVPSVTQTHRFAVALSTLTQGERYLLEPVRVFLARGPLPAGMGHLAA